MARNLVQLKDSDNNNMYPMNPTFQITSESDLVTLHNTISIYESIQIRMDSSVCNSLFGENSTAYGIAGKLNANIMDVMFETGSSRIVIARFQNGVLTGYKKIALIEELPIYLNKTLNSVVLKGASGFITTSSTEANICIPISLNPTYTNFAITKLVCNLRTTGGGYLGGAINSDLTSYITKITLHKQQALIYLLLTKSTGWGIANNTPICGDVTITGSFS